jgi:hypothetical protein
VQLDASENKMPDIGDDVLRGIVAIAAFRNEKPRRTLYLAEKRLIPVGKEGNTYVASKRRLLEHHQQVTSGEPDEAA